MPRDLFGDLQHAAGTTTGSRYTVPVSFALHLAGVGSLVAAALPAPAVLPAPAAGGILMIMAPPIPRRRPCVRRGRQRPLPRHRRIRMPHPAAPDGFAPEPVVDYTLPDAGVDGVLPGVSDFEQVVVGEPPPPPAARAPSKPYRVGGEIRQPQKLQDVRPVYPAIAQAARVQGVVIIEATLDTSGRVSAARVLRSIPLLDDAALTAVRQWVYTPTTLNGEPVSVLMTVTVNFQLQ
ncbi:MAG: energy transducer TonB [Vicinamibacterales bacterium]